MRLPRGECLTLDTPLGRDITHNTPLGRDITHDTPLLLDDHDTPLGDSPHNSGPLQWARGGSGADAPALAARP